MLDIILETIRAILVAIIFFTLVFSKNSKTLKTHGGWFCLVSGFALIFLGMVVDITDNFPELNKFIIIGDTPSQAFIEKVVCYLLGFLLLALGFWKWLPSIAELEISKSKIEDSNEKLTEALSQVKSLEGIIPICSHCKNIRNDEGYWSQVEEYVSQNTNAGFTHSICPDCSKQHYSKYV